MSNPFEIINNRLNNIEELLLDIKHQPKEVTSLHPRKNVTPEFFCTNHQYMALNTFYQRAPKGKVPGAFKIGNRWFIDLEEFEASSKQKMKLVEDTGSSL